MKRAFLLLLPAVLLVLLSIVGCDDETEPRFTRIRVYPECGIAPLQVDCLAIVTGGNESGDPTGGNNNLAITWDFGDDSSSGSTSIAYHTFQEPNDYLVTATATDSDGKTTSISQMVRVTPDTLTIIASTDFGEAAITVNDTVHFDIWASSCNIDPDVDGDYRKLVFKWEMNDGTGTQFNTHRPAYQFVDAGTYDVTLSATYPAMAATRYATLHLVVVDP